MSKLFKNISRPLADRIGTVIARSKYIIEGTLNFENNGKYS